MNFRALAFPLLAALTLTASACSKDPGKVAGEHASKQAKPGSHEDWCGEHSVPESQCTKCDPKLSAAFKATGDWCDQHGLPKSQCTKCDPSLKIARPPKGS